MAKKPTQPLSIEEALALASQEQQAQLIAVKLEDSATTSYAAETIMGRVNLRAEQVEGKTTEELQALLKEDSYLNRVRAYKVVKLTETVLAEVTI